MAKYQQMIHDIIYKQRRHLTAEEIYQELKQQEPKVVLATVYNNLNSMYQKNQIRKIMVDGMPDHYDQNDRHDHMICRQCGEITDFSFNDLTRSLERHLSTKITSYDLQINYICPKCQKRHH